MIDKNVRSVLAGIVILLVVLLGLNNYLIRLKLKQAEMKVTLLNNTIRQKDSAITQLTAEAQSKQAELNSIKTGLDKVQKELDAAKENINAATTGPGQR